MKIPSSVVTQMSERVQNVYSQFTVAMNQRQMGISMPYESFTKCNVVGGMPNMFEQGTVLSVDPKKAFQILEKKSLWAGSNTMKSYYESLSSIVDKGNGKITILDDYQNLENAILSFNITPGNQMQLVHNSSNIKALLENFVASINSQYQQILSLEKDLKNEKDAYLTDFSLDKKAKAQFDEIKQTNPQYRAPLYQDFLCTIDELSEYFGVKNADPQYNENLTLTASLLNSIQKNQNQNLAISGIQNIEKIKTNQDQITGKLPAFELLSKEINEIKEEFCKLAHIAKIKINNIIKKLVFNNTAGNAAAFFTLSQTGWVETSSNPHEVIKVNENVYNSTHAKGTPLYTFFTTSSQQEVQDGWKAIADNNIPNSTTSTLKELSIKLSTNVVQQYQRYDKNSDKYANEVNKLNNTRKNEIESFMTNQINKMQQIKIVTDVIMKLMKDSYESISQIILR